ncbi:MAG: hypothetical protein B5M52_05620 [Helicobacteraceae bacterium 4484_230]|nr:MAG: hypothetical protein B5M52_05620 [Helicobacteraceae bacterium 4484_230]
MKKRICLAGILTTVLLIQGCSEGSNDRDVGESFSSSKTEKVAQSSSSKSTSSASNSSTSSSSTASIDDAVGTSSSSVSSQNGNTATDTVLHSLELTVEKSELAENNETLLTVNGSYSNGEKHRFIENINWQISRPGIVEIRNGRLIAKKEGTTTIRAKVDGKLSSPKTITVYKVVHGHRLPPEPDPKINNSTLLGIDSNNNGVRDDVERWIYTRYDKHFPCKMVEVNITIPATGKMITGYKRICEDHKVPYHQIVREIAMQGARAAQIIIQEPDRARETREVFARAYNCASYFDTWAKYEHEPILFDEDTERDYSIVGKEFDSIQFNTARRSGAYAKYNFALSGGVYGSPGSNFQYRQQCDFNVTKLLRENP